MRAIAISLVLTTALAHADDSAARAAELFKQGRALIGEGKIAQACEAFASSLALDSQLGTKLNLADCWAKLERNADAYRMFEDAAKDATGSGKPGRATYAKEQITALRAKVGIVRLRIAEPSITGLLIELGPASGLRGLPRQEWGQPQVVDPGMLIISASAPNYQPFRNERSIAAGDDVAIDVPALKSAVTGPSERHVVRQRSRAPLWIGAAGGLVLFGTSGTLGLVARSNYVKAVEAQDRDAVHRAAVLADVGTGVAIAGAAVIVAGVIWYFVAPEQVIVTPTATASSASLVVEGRF